MAEINPPHVVAARTDLDLPYVEGLRHTEERGRGTNCSAVVFRAACDVGLSLARLDPIGAKNGGFIAKGVVDELRPTINAAPAPGAVALFEPEDARPDSVGVCYGVHHVGLVEHHRGALVLLHGCPTCRRGARDDLDPRHLAKHLPDFRLIGFGAWPRG